MNPTRIASAVALLGLLNAASAQTAAPASAQKIDKVTITGSSIKRLADEKAMPIEVMTADQIRDLGVSSADQLTDLLSANVAGNTNQVTNNAVFGGDAEKTLGGANFANLRGLGPAGTLVLLNGRRISTHGMSGGSVDLNAIPMDAIERVEVLKDGASAVYGTDAIGGVMNFITRTDYEGVSVRASHSTPQAAGGGQTTRFSGSVGLGNLVRDGFNMMATVTLDHNRILRGPERSWATGYQPELGLTPDTSSSVHANIIPSTGTALTSAGTTVGTSGDATRYTNLNLLAIQGRCQDIPNQVPLAANIQTWDLFGHTQASSRYRCGRDYGRNYTLRTPQEAINGLLRGTFRINDNHQFAVELIASEVRNRGEYSPIQLSSTANAVMNLQPTGPNASPYYLDMRALVNAAQFDPTRPLAYRVNFLHDLGHRIRENENSNVRAQAVFDGTVWGLDYSMGIGYGESRSSSTLINGFANNRKLVDLLASGKYNPFIMPGQTQTADVIAKFEDMQMRGRIYDGKTSVKQADATLSGPLGKFMAGDIEFAAGVNLRREDYLFSGSRSFLCIDSVTNATFAANDNAALTYGCPGNTSSPLLSRDIVAAYGELVLHPLKSLELTLQVRHDRYEQIGSSTNPKLGLKFQPLDSLLLRASASTGFRAPSIQQVRQGVVESNLTGQFRDPELCADINAPKDPTQCARLSMPFRAGGNANLKPETSRQASVGLVFEPMKNLQFQADYWQVELDDRIVQLSTAEMISNYPYYKEKFVRDPATGVIQYIQAGYVNAASSATKGLDFGVKHQMQAFGGRIRSSLSGTKMISAKARVAEAAPEIEYVGKWSNTTLYLPWRLNASIGYSTGLWGVTASGIYRDSYQDQNRGPTAQGGANYTTNPAFIARKVKSYSTMNLVGNYTGLKGITLSASVLNLFDTDPPFTWHNVDSASGAGWDPRVADPRGRTFSVSASWKL